MEKIGCVEDKDMNSGMKYLRDLSRRNIASPRSLCSQKSITEDFTRFLKVNLEGGLLRNVIGWGRRYLRDILCNSRNQDFEEGLAEAKTFLA